MNKIICIDPGHGGADVGASSPIRERFGDMLATKESDFTLDLAKRTRDFLLRSGQTVVMTHEDQSTVSLHGRCEFQKKMKSDVFVSIHVNASFSPLAEGIEAFSYMGSRHGELLRNCIMDEIEHDFRPDWIIRGRKVANFAVLRETSCPAALVECGFISNPKDEIRLSEEKTREKFAEAIGRGILVYLNKMKGV